MDNNSTIYNEDNNPRIKASAGTRILVLLVLAFVGLIAVAPSVLILDALPKFDATLIMVLLQDLLVFIAPAIITAYIFTKRPWHQLSLDVAPTWRALALVVIIAIVSMPALNWLVYWNEHIHLPESMHNIEQMMHDAENAAQLMTRMLLNETSLLPLMAVFFVVGIMAGVSEEFFFRGGMLRTFKNGGNSHFAVWTVGIVFSAMHMQFFGFFPRMILGVWLGYLLVWTRSLWVPIIAHALNNSVVIFTTYLCNIGVADKGWFEAIGVPQDGSFPVMAIASAVATVTIVVAAKRSNLLKTE